MAAAKSNTGAILPDVVLGYGQPTAEWPVLDPGTPAGWGWAAAGL